MHMPTMIQIGGHGRTRLKQMVRMLDSLMRLRRLALQTAILLIALWPAIGRCDLADIVISNAKVISPPDTVMENATVVITHGKITYVGPAGRQIRGRHFIDAHGRAVIPVLIYTHVHLNIGPFASHAIYDLWVTRGSGQLLREYIRRGFTTIQSLGE